VATFGKCHRRISKNGDDQQLNGHAPPCQPSGDQDDSNGAETPEYRINVAWMAPDAEKDLPPVSLRKNDCVNLRFNSSDHAATRSQKVADQAGIS
jgi:hypothetical protein